MSAPARSSHGFSKGAPAGFSRFALYQYPCNAQPTFGGHFEMAERKNLLSNIYLHSCKRKHLRSLSQQNIHPHHPGKHKDFEVSLENHGAGGPQTGDSVLLQRLVQLLMTLALPDEHMDFVAYAGLPKSFVFENDSYHNPGNRSHLKNLAYATGLSEPHKKIQKTP